MGACLSCLRGRDDDKSPSRRRTAESQPLLDESNDMYGGFGSTDHADQLAQNRQQELSQVVQATHEYFIDVSSMAHPENPEPQTDVSALRQSLESKAAAVTIDLPALRALTAEEREILQRDSSALGARNAAATAPSPEAEPAA